MGAIFTLRFYILCPNSHALTHTCMHMDLHKDLISCGCLTFGKVLSLFSFTVWPCHHVLFAILFFLKLSSYFFPYFAHKALKAVLFSTSEKYWFTIIFF